MSDRRVFDPGLQPERTALSWRRAGLSLGGASLLLARVLAEISVPSAVAVGVAGVGLAIATLAAGELRYRSHHRRLLAARVEAAGERIPLARGGLPFFFALTTTVLGLAAIVSVVLFALKVN